MEALARATRAWAATAGVGIRVLTGDAAGSSDRTVVSPWLGRVIRCETDVLLAVAGSSWGVSALRAHAEELRVPTFTAMPTGVHLSATVGPCAAPAVSAAGIFDGPSALATAAERFLRVFEAEIRFRRERRLRTRPELEGERQSLLQAWHQLEPDEQVLLAIKLGLSTVAIDDLLSDPSSFCEHAYGDLHDLRRDIDALRAATPSAPEPPDAERVDWQQGSLFDGLGGPAACPLGEPTRPDFLAEKEYEAFRTCARKQHWDLETKAKVLAHAEIVLLERAAETPMAADNRAPRLTHWPVWIGLAQELGL